MFKKFSIFIMAAIVFTSCVKKTERKEAVQLTVDGIIANAVDYVNKNMSLTGTVAHVCEHGGKRMFIMGDKPGQRFKIIAGPAIGSFDIRLEGSDVRVEGIIREQKVDEAFLDNWEQEIDGSTKPEIGHQGLDNHDEDNDNHHEDTLRQIQAMRKKLIESGKETLSFYSLECNSVNRIK